MNTHLLLTLPVAIPLLTLAACALLRGHPLTQRSVSVGGSVALLLAALAFAGFIRLAPLDPARWHVSLAEPRRTGKPNDVRLRPEGGDIAAPVFALPPADLAAKIAALALAEPHTRLLAGSVAGVIESGDYRARCDRICVVDCPEDLQVTRVHQRNALPEEQIRAIMAAQASRAQRLAVADDVIDNSGTLAELEAQVERLHAAYLVAADVAGD